MNNTILTARVSDQHICLVNETLIASGSVNVVQIRFEFCNLWTGCGKTAVFYRDEDHVYHVPIRDKVATVPHEVLADEGYFYFGVLGVADNIRPTEVIKVKVVKGAITSATAEPDDPTPDIYQQLLAQFGLMNERLDETTELRDECAAAIDTLVLTHNDFVSGGYVEALKETNTGKKLLFWVGTEAEYAQDKDNMPANTFCITTDGPTADDLRDEVAAFGLGGAALKNWADVDTLTAPGWYRFHDEGGIVIKDTTYNYAYMRVDSFNHTNATQVVYALNSDRLQNTYVRSLQAGTWTPWEKDILEKELRAEKAEILNYAQLWDNDVRREVTLAFENFSETVAPAGYGLGAAEVSDWGKVDEITAPGWYSFHKDNGIVIKDTTYNYAYMRVDSFNHTNATQVVYALNSDRLQNTYVRYLQAGTWTPWETDILEKELLAEKADILATAQVFDNNVRKEVTLAFENFSETVAPAGYGLGTVAASKNWVDVDTLTQNGWYKFETDAGVSAGGITCSFAYMRVDAYNDKHVTQTLYLVSSGHRYTLVRHRITGKWESEWAWVNPPLKPGIEYLTTELWNDKPVYTQRKALALPKDNTFVSDTFGLPDGAIIVRHYAKTAGYCLPFGAAGNAEAWVTFSVNDYGLFYCERSPVSAVDSDTLRVQIWYTKN